MHNMQTFEDMQIAHIMHLPALSIKTVHVNTLTAAQQRFARRPYRA